MSWSSSSSSPSQINLIDNLSCHLPFSEQFTHTHKHIDVLYISLLVGFRFPSIQQSKAFARFTVCCIILWDKSPDPRPFSIRNFPFPFKYVRLMLNELEKNCKQLPNDCKTFGISSIKRYHLSSFKNRFVVMHTIRILLQMWARMQITHMRVVCWHVHE